MKVRKPEALLPLHVGTEPCPDCLAEPGAIHQLSCRQVSAAQFRDYLAAQREQMLRQARRDARVDRAAWWVMVAVVLLVAALVGGFLL